MARPTLVIDFSTEAAKAGVFSGLALERSFMRPVDGDFVRPLSDICSDVRNAGYKTFSKVIVGVPQTIVSARVVNVPIKDMSKLREVLPFEAGELFLNNADELIFSAEPLASGSVVAVAADKRHIRAIIDALQGASIAADFLSVSLFSRHLLLNELHKGAGSAAFIGKDFVAAAKGGVPCLFRNIAGLDDMRLALLALKEVAVEAENIYATGAALEMLDLCETKEVSGTKEAGVKLVEGERYSDEKSGLYALALRFSSGAASTDVIDFKVGGFAEETDLRAGKGLRTGALLLAAFASVWLVYSYLRYSSFVSGGREMDSAMIASYRAAFPDEAAPPAAASQLEIKVRDIKQAQDVLSNAVWPAEAMTRLTQAAGKTAIRMREMRLSSARGQDKGRFIASCEAASFEEADRFREKVSGLAYFKDVVVTDVKQSALGGVNFNLSASL